jgi:enoyl-CoA hydratase/carnithine racemase
MNDFETIIFEKSQGIGWITLNRPRVLNAYNIQMRDELYEVLTAIQDDPEVLVVVFQGAGERAFCVGADLTEFGTAPSRVIARQVRWERDVWGLLLHLKQPLLAALHGYVLGSGVEIASCCDIRIAAEDAIFGMPEVSLGMIPAAGGSQTLPRLLRPGRALEILLTGQRINAAEAYRIGLVNRVVPRQELLPTVEEVAARIMSLSQEVVRRAKEAVVRGLDMSLAEGLELESRLCALLRR